MNRMFDFSDVTPRRFYVWVVCTLTVYIIGLILLYYGITKIIPFHIFAGSAFIFLNTFANIFTTVFDLLIKKDAVDAAMTHEYKSMLLIATVILSIVLTSVVTYEFSQRLSIQ